MATVKVEKQERLEAFYAYLPAFITLILTAITFVIYTTVMTDQRMSTYLAILAIAPTPFIFTFFNRKFQLGLPKYLIILMCSHAVMSVDMGTTLGLYWRLTWWDSLVHCYFGFLACAVLYNLYFHFRDGKPNLIEYIVILLLVVSFAALWEVYEFFASKIFQSDMQDIIYLLERGMNPLTDTIFDIMVATLGALVFYTLLFLITKIKKLRKKRQARTDGEAA